MKVRLLALLCSLLLCFGCLSPKQRLSRLLTKYPELVTYQTDTVTVTVIKPHTEIIGSIDTEKTKTLMPGEPTDSVLHTPDLTIDDLPGVRVSLWGKAKGKIKVEALPDTTHIKKPVIYPTVTPSPPTPKNEPDQNERIIWVAVLMTILILYSLKSSS